jgi:arsenate reductase (thioredoxin)
MLKVLFVCVHNSARSQMAETFLNDLGKDHFYAESAGIEAGKLNPYVIKVMAELGYDISQNETHAVFDYFKEGRKYDAVIKVCDQANGQRCPIFPSSFIEENWDLPDPSSFSGTEEAILERTRVIRDLVKDKIDIFIEKHKHKASRL